MPTGSGSNCGAEEAPENGLPRNITTNDTTPMPAGPTSAASPATAVLTARVVSANTPASAHQSPVRIPSQLCASAAATAPIRTAAPARAPTARMPRNRSRVTAAPAAMPARASDRTLAARASGRTLAPRAAPRGSFCGAGTTSTVLTRVPSVAACWFTACWSSWATAGLAADAVSSSGPWGVTTIAPYTARSSMAARAAAWSA